MVYNYLYHYGIPGMRWGVRRSQKQLARSRKRKPDIHDDYKNTHDKKSIKSMSNNELDSRINRLNKEKQYRKLRSEEAGRFMEAGSKQVAKYVALATGISTAIATTATLGVKYGKPLVDKIINKHISKQNMAWVL